jgi:branched-chain amino acid transport system ATP-binding protein
LKIIETLGLSKRFGGVQAIDHLDFFVQEREILGLIGPNGAGKTTLFNLLSGVYAPSEGKILYQHQNLTGLKPYQITKLGIARTFQKIRLFPRLTVLKNVSIAQHCRVEPKLWDVFPTKKHRFAEEKYREKALSILKFLGLESRQNDLAMDLPYGRQKTVEIARAMATEPQVLLLDEPAAGLNTRESEELISLVGRIQGMGITVIIIEHDMDVIMGISDRIVVLNFGQKIFEGTPEETQRDEAVRTAYLGEEIE